MDDGHYATELILRETEADVDRIYRQAVKETQQKLDDYLSRFKVKDGIKQAQVKSGEITQAEYNQWRIGQMAMGQRWEEMRDTLAQDLHNSNAIARSIVLGHTPDVYAVNHNYATFQVEKGSMIDTSYTLYDRQTVERLIRDQPNLLPAPGPQMRKTFEDFDAYKAGENVDITPKMKKSFDKLMNSGKDIRWQKGQIQSVMTQAILQGESIPHISQRIAKTMGELNRSSTTRYARTAVTGAQNAGRVDAYKRAENMGIKLEQEWMATLDNRTRYDHRYLDGQHVPVGEPFKVDGYEIRYPGDPKAPAHLIWNCRCTLVPWFDDIESDAPRNSKLGDMSYEEWKGELTTVPNYANDEVEALQQYTRSTYSGVNSYLRGEEFFKSEYIEQLVTDIDSAMNKSPIPKETTVFRGASDADLRGMFGDGLRRSWFEKADNLKSLEGKTGVFKSYLSTSVGGLQSQFSHGLEWTFVADKGTHAVDLRNISVQSSENEFLFDRNSKIEILRVDVNEDEEGYINGVIKIFARIRRG